MILTDEDKVQYCYSCYDQMMFQLYGQTRGYDPEQQSKLYLHRWQEEGKPDVTCDLCDNTVTYVLREDGKYTEVRKEESDQ